MDKTHALPPAKRRDFSSNQKHREHTLWGFRFVRTVVSCISYTKVSRFWKQLVKVIANNKKVNNLR